MPQHTCQIRVRYSETDQMGTYYNSRALEWFEVGRSELSRSMGLPYAEWEQRGAFLPVVEAQVKFHARAKYDDLLSITTSMELVGHARVRFDCVITKSETGEKIASGHTLHAIINQEGKPMRAPDWLLEALAKNSHLSDQ